MLQKLRSSTEGIIAGIIFGLVCITFAFFGVGYYLQSRNNDKVVAKVAKVKITASQLDRATQNALLNLQKTYQKPIDLTDEERTLFRQGILKGIIQETAIQKEARNLGLALSKEQVKAVLQNEPLFQENGKFSFEKFRNILYQNSYSMEAYLIQLKNATIEKQLTDVFTSGSFLLPSEKENLFANFNEVKDVSYSILSVKDAEAKVSVTPDEVKKYYDDHQNEFVTKDKVSLAYLVLDAKDLEKNFASKITDATLQKYYDDHLDDFTQMASWQIKKLVITLKDPNKASAEEYKKLADLAKNISKLPTVSCSEPQLSEAEKAALTDVKEGKLTDSFIDDGKLCQYQLVKYIPEKVETFFSVKDAITKIVKKEAIETEFNKRCSDMAELAYTNSDGLDTVAKSLNLKIATTGLFSADSQNIPGADILASKAQNIIKLAFSDALLKQNYNSDLIEITPTVKIVFRVNKFIPEEVLSFAKVQDKIKEALLQKKAAEYLYNLGSDLVTTMQNAGGYSLKLDEMKPTWHNVALSRESKDVDINILYAVFSSPLEVKVLGTQLQNGDFVIIRINKVTKDKAKTVSAEQKKNFLDNVENYYGLEEYNAYVSSLLARTKIKIFE